MTYIKNFLFHYALLQPLIYVVLSLFFFIFFRKYYLANLVYMPANSFNKFSTKTYFIFFEGITQSFRSLSIHTLFSSYFSLCGSGYLQVRQSLMLFLGAQYTLLALNYVNLLLFATNMQTYLPLVVLALAPTLWFIGRARLPVYAMIFFALFYLLIGETSSLVFFKETYNFLGAACFLIPLLIYILLPSSFLFVILSSIFLLQAYDFDKAQSLFVFLIPTSMLLFSLRSLWVSRQAQSKVKRLAINLVLLSLLEILLVSLLSLFLSTFVAFLIATIFLVVLVKYISDLVLVIVPNKKYKEANALVWYSLGLCNSATLQLEILTLETRKKAALVFSMLEMMYNDLSEKDYQVATEKRIQKYEKITDSVQEEIQNFSENLMQLDLSVFESKKIRSLVRISNELESVADAVAALYKLINNKEVFLKSHIHASIQKLYTKTFRFYEKVFSDLNDKAFFVQNKLVFKYSIKVASEFAEFKEAMIKSEVKMTAEDYENLFDAYHLIKKIKSSTSNVYQSQQGIS